MPWNALSRAEYRKSKNLVLVRDPAFGADQDPSDAGVAVTSTCVQRSVAVLKCQRENMVTLYFMGKHTFNIPRLLLHR